MEPAYNAGAHVTFRQRAWWEKDTCSHEHLCDNLIGLIRPDVHLESGGWLEQFPHSR